MALHRIPILRCHESIVEMDLIPKTFQPSMPIAASSCRRKVRRHDTWKLLMYGQGGSFLMGQFTDQLRGNPGEPYRRWVNEIPNNGLVRYLDIFNLERVAVVKPRALADVLVHNNYDFEKPETLRRGISRILGMGLFLAEGDAHKVSAVHSSLNRC